MAATLTRSEVVSCANPRLVFFSVSSEFQLVDLHALEFVVLDSAGVQVFPASGRETVDLDACPSGAKLATGVYAAAGFTVAVDAGFERHTIRWFFITVDGEAEQVRDEHFDVVDAARGGNGYALPSDFRDEGFTVAMASDARLVRQLTIASRRIDDVCGQFFEPRMLTLELDGRDSRRMCLPVPVIAVSEVRVDGTPQGSSSYVVSNRHLRSYGQPDDRRDPHLAFVINPDLAWSPLVAARWADGRHNVSVDGVFGFTDPPGPVGSTPIMIREATMLLAVKMLSRMGSDDRNDAAMARFVNRVKTRDQEYQVDTARAFGGTAYITGDIDVDNLIAPYLANIYIGAV